MKILKKNKQEQGITLIALVVTIIVLLILAGVTISAVLGENGLVQKAKQGREKYAEASVNEQRQLNEAVAFLDEYVGGGSSTPPAPTLSAVETLLGYTGNTNSNDLVVGDHINYYYAKGTAPIECVVLYKDETHGIQVVSANTVGSNITLGSSDFDTLKSSYNSAVSTLNAAANSYVPEGGMATDGRCVGSNPLIGQKNSAESNAMMTASNDPTGSERAWMTSNGWYNSFKLGDEYYSEDYNTMKNMTTPIHNLGKSYWLASRGGVCAYFHDSYFYVRFVNSSGDANDSLLCNVSSNGNTYSYASEYAFRPVFFLKSDIPVEKIS